MAWWVWLIIVAVILIGGLIALYIVGNKLQNFRPYPLILWITVLPLLSAPVPLAAAERPSVASQ